MKKMLAAVAILMLAVMTGGVAQAADNTATQNVTITVKEVAKLKATSVTVGITIDAPTTAGEDPSVTITDNNNTCGYTSIVVSGQTRKLTGSTDSDLSTKGISLTLLPEGVPDGCGTASGTAVTLTTSGADLITAIGSCKTGNKNITLTYGLTVSDITKLTAGSVPVTVTLTLTD